VRRALPLVVAMLSLILAAGQASAATAYRTYSGTLSGNHGTARLTVYTSKAGAITVNAKSMAAGSWTESIYRGTCSSRSTRVALLPRLVVGSSGSITRTNSLSTTQMATLKCYRSVVRLVLGSKVVCAPFAAVSLPVPVPKTSCHPSYRPVCLRTDAGDYDCAGGSGNGPNYVAGPFEVVGYDEFDLDRDGDGIGCENG
jgi:hypothetical protein